MSKLSYMCSVKLSEKKSIPCIPAMFVLLCLHEALPSVHPPVTTIVTVCISIGLLTAHTGDNK